MKYYYDCPIKAAYMAQEFGVKFQQWLYEDFFAKNVGDKKLFEQDIHNILEEIPYHFRRDRKFDYENRYIVVPESEAIFKPKESDLILSDAIIEHWYNSDNKIAVNGKIIMRDNKPFFMPEVENENN